MTQVNSPSAPVRQLLVVVVGASRGIGAAVVERFAGGGDTVVATHRGSGIPVSSHAAGDVVPAFCDVRSSESVDAAFDEIERRLGPPDIVVITAGVSGYRRVANMDDQTWALTLDTNLTGAFRVARRAARTMSEAGEGSIVFVAASAGALGQAGYAHYAASKSGLVGLARSLARELAERGIRVNVVSPGPIQTDLTIGLNMQQQAALRSAIPLRRYASPDEISEVIELVSRASFMTGAVVPVDGGIAIGI